MKLQILTALATAEEELPLWKELWVYFYNTYFTDETSFRCGISSSGSFWDFAWHPLPW